MFLSCLCFPFFIFPSLKSLFVFCHLPTRVLEIFLLDWMNFLCIKIVTQGYLLQRNVSNVILFYLHKITLSESFPFMTKELNVIKLTSLNIVYFFRKKKWWHWISDLEDSYFSELKWIFTYCKSRTNVSIFFNLVNNTSFHCLTFKNLPFSVFIIGKRPSGYYTGGMNLNYKIFWWHTLK